MEKLTKDILESYIKRYTNDYIIFNTSTEEELKGYITFKNHQQVNALLTVIYNRHRMYLCNTNISKTSDGKYYFNFESYEEIPNH